MLVGVDKDKASKGPTSPKEDAKTEAKKSKGARFITRVLNSAFSLLVIAGIVGVAMFANQRIQQDAAVASEAARAAQVATAVPVRTQVAVAEDAFLVPRSYVGLIVPDRSVSLGFEINGRVATRHVSVGERVRQGDLLATLDQRRTEANLINARASRERAQAVLALREAEAERMETLVEGGIVTQQAFDQAGSNLQAAQADLDSANAQLRSLEIDFEDTQLLAPFDGEVTAINFDLGDVVAPDRQILTMTSRSQTEAHIGLPVEVAEGFDVGDRVSIVHRGAVVNAEVSAVVSRVNAATQTIDLVVAFPNGTVAIEGERVALLTEQRVEQVGFWVPTGALVSDLKGLFAVQIAAEASDDQFEIARAPVVVHFTDGEVAYVSGALAEGDQIVTEGTNRVSPGQSVVVAALEADQQ
ncbi:MAG: efflux RND transporter periplasmic adaptor subunit [Devosiaceae bacterium]|nr:efflux RND transporter periplasmic adaptor subunit [Devosiaceae bacterium MH13]